MLTSYYCTRSQGEVKSYNSDTGVWTDVSVPISENPGAMYDLMVVPNTSSEVIVIGGNNSIFKTLDGGTNWVRPGGDYTTLPENYRFFETYIVDTDFSYGVGEKGVVVKSVNGGLDFNITSTLPTPSTNQDDDYVANAIHFITSLIGVVRTTRISTGETFAYKTSDGGATWSILNSGTAFNSNENDGDVGGNDKYSHGAIYLSDDELTIVVLTKAGAYRSTNGGTSFTLVLDLLTGYELRAIGIHMTWLGADMWITGLGDSIFKSDDLGATWTTLRGYTDKYTFINAAYFHTPLEGFTSYHRITGLINTTDDGALTSINPVYENGAIEAIWSIVATPCYVLTDCAGLAEPIYTSTELSEFDGEVITLADDTNHEVSGCWLVSSSNDCVDTVEVRVYKCYADCQACLPSAPPVQVPCPRPVDPGYNTGNCDPNIVEDVKCTFAEIMYQKMMSIRYKIKFCCGKDEDDAHIKNEKISMLLRASDPPTLYECNQYNIYVPSFPGELHMTYEDCYGETQTYIESVGEGGGCYKVCGRSEVQPDIKFIATYLLEIGSVHTQEGDVGPLYELYRSPCYSEDYLATVLETADNPPSEGCVIHTVGIKETGSGFIEAIDCGGNQVSIPYDVDVNVDSVSDRTFNVGCLPIGSTITITGGHAYNQGTQPCNC